MAVAPCPRDGGPVLSAQGEVLDRARPGSAEPDAAWRAIHRAACLPYRASGRFAWHFARGKLGGDPVFRALLERGWLGAGTRVLDIGCGQGLLASLLAAAAREGTIGWPASWPAAPRCAAYTGIELMRSDIARAESALAASPLAPRFIQGDLRDVPLPACDVVVILDVLHYVDPAAQELALQRARAALGPRGRLLLRVGDASSRRGFAISQWVDAAVALCRGHRAPPTFGRPLSEWTTLLERLGFAVQAVPMSAGTLFANVVLVAHLP